MEKEEKVKILQDLIKIKSINGNEEEVATYLQNLLKNHGIDSKLIKYAEGRSSLVVEIKKGSSHRVLGLTGHMDVVDIGNEELWTYPPFSATIDGDKLYGRGSTDMKSGLAAITIAMIELKEADVNFDGTVRLLATVGEEVGELGGRQLTELGYADDLSGLIIAEPTNYNLVYTHMGSINYSVVSEGKAAHSSQPQEGFNAINHLNEFITAINAEMAQIAEEYPDSELGTTIHNITVIRGGDQVNAIPWEARLEGNIRSVPTYDNDKNSTLIQTIQSEFETPLPVIGIAGTTDAAEFVKAKNKFDFVVFGPGVSTLPHQINEYVEISNYLDMIGTYQNIAKKYLG
ncbi:ArgE/DapE family deacylase [Lactococcus formosensis]|uniref:ArgE/DapE family deacylase n=1 Tax=Lactococcus formosensis TaxID=1281486 RepID=UPI00288D5738|nr:ArgE/DapE family deacylase [Lactococcus formosensis]MDT2726565.1 ArgE/DapE family deacylase [Lactococcus formosensis]